MKRFSKNQLAQPRKPFYLGQCDLEPNSWPWYTFVDLDHWMFGI